jgi:hypothetical protein
MLADRETLAACFDQQTLDAYASARVFINNLAGPDPLGILDNRVQLENLVQTALNLSNGETQVLLRPHEVLLSVGELPLEGFFNIAVGIVSLI